MKKLLASLFLCSAVIAADITLTWDFNAAEEEVTTYKIYEKSGSTLTLVATVPGTTNVATITGISPGRRTYVATAVNLWGESPPSNEARTPSPGTSPKNLRIMTTITINVE